MTVRVTPRSSRNKLERVGDQFKVWVMASPTDGQANDAVCQVVARALKVPPSAVSVKRGHAGREKLLSVDGITDVELFTRLDSL